MNISATATAATVYRGTAYACMLLGAIGALSFWPGLLTYDSVRQYYQAVTDNMDDWHPPIMEWIWDIVRHAVAGPAPMLLLQVGLWIGGMASLIHWALKNGRHRLAVAFGISVLMPLPAAMMGAVQKDSLMAGAFTASIGLLALARLRPPSPGTRVMAGATSIFSAMLRFNAFPAGLPILIAAAARRWRNAPVRFTVLTACCSLVLMSAMPIANGLTGARRSDVGLSLVIFDLAGISHYSGENMFPAMDVERPMDAVERCYTPLKWDRFSWWALPRCPINFTNFRDTLRQHHLSAYQLWFDAVRRHPMAYLQHRFQHWNLNLRFIVPHNAEPPFMTLSAPNIWHYGTYGTPVKSVTVAAASWSARTPLGWPCTWLALAFGTALIAWRQATNWLSVPLSLSAFCYSAAYLVMSVASDLRYHLWTLIAALLAALITASDLGNPLRDGRWGQWAVFVGPALIVTCIAGLARAIA